MSAMAFGVLLFLGRRMTFRADEWTVAANPPGGSIASWLEPHNEHWSTVLYLVYEPIFQVFGLRTYLPYLAVLLLIHLIAAAGLYRLLLKVSHPVVALAAAAILLG